MNRIIAAALAAFLLPVCMSACLDEDLTAVEETRTPATDAGEDLLAADGPAEPGEGEDSLEPGETPPAPDDPVQPGVNHPPSVRIEDPCDGLRIYEGRGMYFVGSASDAEDGELSNRNFKWDVDGRPIPGCDGWDGWASACADGGFIDRFELGPQVLTLTVTDSDGAQGSASITIWGVEFTNASFTDDILSSFTLAYCESCHGAERAEGGIRLDSYEAIMTGGNEHGPLIVEGDPTGGILIPQILSNHYYVDGYGIHLSLWVGETIIPVWIMEGARNTDHPHPIMPEPRCGYGLEGPD